MKKLESSLTNMVLVLVASALVMGGVLALVNHITEGPINEQKEKSLADGIQAVMGGGELTVTANDTIVKDVDKDGKSFELLALVTSDGEVMGTNSPTAIRTFDAMIKQFKLPIEDVMIVSNKSKNNRDYLNLELK